MGKPNWAAAAQSRIDSFAKPPGALGTLESIAVTLCHQQATLRPAAAPASLLTFCADHGVKQAEPAISPFPPAVTQNIFRALAAGVAGASVLALSAGATCTVVDVGVDGDVSDVAATGAGCTVRHDKLARGSHDMLSTQAMGAELCARAIAAGRAAVRSEVSQKGVRVIAVGEVGIGNTTAAAALLSVLTGAPPVDCCGAGTGLDDVSVKVRVVQSALQLHAGVIDGGEKGKAARASAALAAVGGLELAAMAGAYMEAASCGVVAVVRPKRLLDESPWLQFTSERQRC
eukprot:COSAG01_NODE_1449_length_10271_cov_6.347976_5_plen_288_part_00